MTATASDADGTVSSVSFYAGTTLIGTDTTSPYSVTWINVAGGSYSLTAVAQDSTGATTTAVVNGECDVDITPTVNALASGSYIATVSAVGSGGSSRSNAAPFTK